MGMKSRLTTLAMAAAMFGNGPSGSGATYKAVKNLYTFSSGHYSGKRREFNKISRRRAKNKVARASRNINHR